MISLLVFTLLAAAPEGEVAFVGGEPGAPARVHIISIPGGAPRAIGPEHVLDAPAWSPDGTRIAFTVEAGGGSRIYLCTAEGKEGRLIDHAQRNNREPVWSPDGTRIAYTAGTGLDAEIVVASAESGVETVWGGGRTSLMHPIWVEHSLLDRIFERLGTGGRPDFLPAVVSADPVTSGATIVAVGLVGTPGALTTDLFFVSESEAIAFMDDLQPSDGVYEEFAPAATRDALAFESNDGGDREIFVLTRRGAWDISNDPAADWRPVWSPDGKWIAFESFRRGTRGIFRCHQRSSRVLRVVADDAADCWGAAWSPDSEWIAYATDKEGAPSVWVTHASGDEEPVRLSPEGMTAAMPAWRPAK